MKRYSHHITIPITTSLTVYVESDEPIESMEQAFEMANEQWGESDVNFCLKGPGNITGYDLCGIHMGEELSSHLQLNRENVCHAVYAETDWETEDHGKRAKG